jgi:mRNA interferase MazF
MPFVPQRSEVWLVSFDPAIGGEIQKTRPALVISNDTANALLNRVKEYQFPQKCLVSTQPRPSSA